MSASKQVQTSDGLVPTSEEQITALCNWKQSKSPDIKIEVDETISEDEDVQNFKPRNINTLQKDDFDDLESLLCSPNMSLGNEDQPLMHLELIPCYDSDVLSILNRIDSSGNCEMSPSSQMDSVDGRGDHDFPFSTLRTRNVTIMNLGTSKYMQVDEGHIMFDELKSQKSSQRIKDFPQCHYIEETEVKYIYGRTLLERQYKHKETNKYLCMRADGSVGLDETPTKFCIYPAKGKAFFIIKESETEHCLRCEEDNIDGQFEAINIKDIEHVPKSCKMVIEKLNKM